MKEFFLLFLDTLLNLVMPASISHRWSLSIRSDLGAVGVADSYTITGDTEENISTAVTAGNIVDEIIPNINCDDLLSFAINADHDITLKFNSRSGPSAPSPISLVAGEAYAWNNKMNTTNPLAGLTLSKVIFDNSAGTAAANCKAVFLMSVGS